MQLVTSNEKNAENPKAVRHVILVRHGHYSRLFKDKRLTDLGREQASLTGTRLRSLSTQFNVKFDRFVTSTMTRAQETSNLIRCEIDSRVEVPTKEDEPLCEGLPIDGHPRDRGPRDLPVFLDGPRIEAAFRKYIHRAEPSQTRHSFEIIVCHAIVIRYFVCRALQVPAEGWTRMSLPHASITWLTIYPTGRVVLQCLGDAGHIPAELMTRKSTDK